MTAADTRFMALALSLGRRGLGHVWPNPAVGCVIVHEGRIVGRGWTQPGGRPHAEAMALEQAGPAAGNGTAYITLEPCAHYSPRGPACSDLLIAAGVSRVVTALTDPDPRTAGQGHARLTAAGITVATNCLASQAATDHVGFLSRVLGGQASVTLKLATTLDGRIATTTGESRWITGALARRDVHAMRARHDAVMVGVGTALADDPDLTVRDLGITDHPLRIVLDSHLRLPVTSRLGQSARRVPVWMVHTDAAPQTARADWTAAGARLLTVTADNVGRLDAFATVIALGQAGLTRLFCEGGSNVAAALLGAGCVDNLLIYQAGRLFGADGLAAVAPMGVTRLFQSPPGFRLVDTRPIGDDVRQYWRRRDLP